MTEKRLGPREVEKRICWKGWRIETWEKAWKKNAQEKAGVKQMINNRIKSRLLLLVRNTATTSATK